MAYNLIVKTLAEKDITEAIEWLHQQSENLPKEFLNDIDISLEIIRENPEHFQKRYDHLRIAFTQKFMYGIYYTIEETTIFVHAVLHSKRNPETGIQRK